MRRAAARFAVAAALLTAALVLRGPSFVPAVIDIDEGLYMLQAREWLRGGLPYVAAWDMHPVGAPTLFALAMGLFGDGIWVLRGLGAACVGATALALVTIARGCGVAVAPAVATGLLYIAGTTLFGGLATNTEILMAPLTAWAMALAAQAPGVAPIMARIAAMGVLIGVALLIKPVAVFEGSLAWLIAIMPSWRAGGLKTARVLVLAVVYAALCATPSVVVAVSYAALGAWEAFLDGAILAPLRYAGGRVPTLDALRYVAAALVAVPWLATLAALGCVGGARGPRQAGLRGVAVLWFAATAAAIVAPGQFYPHYFLLALPPLALLAMLGARAVARGIGARHVGRLAVAALVLAGLDALTRMAVPRLYDPAGLTRPDPVREVAAALAAHVAPGDPVWVVNYPPVVHVLAGAGLSTRYVFPQHLTGAHAAVTGIDADAEVRRILDSRPAALVVYRGWWLQVRPALRPVIEAALAGSYARVAEIDEALGPVEIWTRR
jgi:4-amino-4-deoxy-L-arabinose transferase-like glycosyltransferase